jgi:cellobiose phosphorylase
MAADVYAAPQHKGRGGWTWYTGSSGWMYQLIVESLLGLKLEVDKLTFAPCLPPEWKSFTIKYRYRNTFYLIKVIQTDAPATNGVEEKGNTVLLIDDKEEHTVELYVDAKTVKGIDQLQQQKV